jgi:hypothetical protein
MADFDRTYAGLRGATDRSVAYDMGLRTHMIRVYNVGETATAVRKQSSLTKIIHVVI